MVRTQSTIYMLSYQSARNILNTSKGILADLNLIFSSLKDGLHVIWVWSRNGTALCAGDLPSKKSCLRHSQSGSSESQLRLTTIDDVIAASCESQTRCNALRSSNYFMAVYYVWSSPLSTILSFHRQRTIQLHNTKSHHS